MRARRSHWWWMEDHNPWLWRSFRATIQYIYQNPIAAQLIQPPETYPHFWINPPITPQPSFNPARAQS